MTLKRGNYLPDELKKDKRLSIRLTQKQFEQLQNISSGTHRNISYFVRELIANFIKTINLK